MAKTTAATGESLPLTRVCRPVIEFIINFDRSRAEGALGEYAYIRAQAERVMAVAEETAMRSDEATLAAWQEFGKNMLVYFVDYKMNNSEWHGAFEWRNEPFEHVILQRSDMVGGQLFFAECDQVKERMQRAQQMAQRGDERYSELLNLYYTCIRLGFKGQWGPGQFGEAGDEASLKQYYTTLYHLLPAFTSTRDLRMFPQAYEHNIERDFNPAIGMTMLVAGLIVACVLLVSGVVFYYGWGQATQVINENAQLVRDGSYGPTK